MTVVTQPTVEFFLTICTHWIKKVEEAFFSFLLLNLRFSVETYWREDTLEMDDNKPWHFCQNCTPRPDKPSNFKQNWIFNIDKSLKSHVSPDKTSNFKLNWVFNIAKNPKSHFSPDKPSNFKMNFNSAKKSSLPKRLTILLKV